MTHKMYERQRVNPLDYIKRLWPGVDVSHIRFNPDVKPQYRRRWQGGCDGTLALVYDDLARGLEPLVNKKSYHKPDAPDGDLSGFRDVVYEVGWMRWATVYGLIELKCGGKHAGQRDRFSIPVRATLIR